MEGLPDSRVDVDDEGTDILPSCPVVGPPRQQPFDDARPTGSALRQELYPGIATLRTLLHALPSSPTRPSASTSSPDRSFVPSHRPPPPPSAQLAPLASALPPTPDSPRLPNFKHLHLTALILSARLSTPAHFLSFTRLPHLTPAPPSLQAHTGSVYCIALRGGLALTGGKDQSVRVWDLADGNERVVGVLEGVHTGSVLTLCTFGCPSSAAEDGASAGGEGEGEGEQAFRVVSGGSDGRLALWEVRRLPPSTADGEAGRWHGECLRAVDAHAESVFGVKSDGDVVVSCSKGAPMPSLALSLIAGLAFPDASPSPARAQIGWSRSSTPARSRSASSLTGTEAPSTRSACARASCTSPRHPLHQLQSRRPFRADTSIMTPFRRTSASPLLEVRPLVQNLFLSTR